jgi:hypothetical protein
MGILIKPYKLKSKFDRMRRGCAIEPTRIRVLDTINNIFDGLAPLEEAQSFKRWNQNFWKFSYSFRVYIQSDAVPFCPFIWRQIYQIHLLFSNSVDPWGCSVTWFDRIHSSPFYLWCWINFKNRGMRSESSHSRPKGILLLFYPLPMRHYGNLWRNLLCPVVQTRTTLFHT